jgi:hypothetical protein
LGISDDNVGINVVWEGIKENIKISAKENPDYYEFNRHKPCFDEKGYELLDPRKPRHRWEDNTNFIFIVCILLCVTTIWLVNVSVNNKMVLQLKSISHRLNCIVYPGKQ